MCSSKEVLQYVDLVSAPQLAQPPSALVNFILDRRSLKMALVRQNSCFFESPAST